MTVFGAIWWLFGSIGLPSPWWAITVGAGLVAGVTLWISSRRRLSGMPPEAVGDVSTNRRFLLVNVVQGAAIAAAIAGANLAHVTTWIPALIALVVGAHFVPLARLFDVTEYMWVAALMVAFGLAGLGIAIPGGDVAAVLLPVCWGCALTLWGMVAWLLARGGWVRRRPPSGPRR